VISSISLVICLCNMHRPVNGRRTSYLIAAERLASIKNKLSHWTPWQQVKNISNRTEPQCEHSKPRGNIRNSEDSKWIHARISPLIKAIILQWSRKHGLGLLYIISQDLLKQNYSPSWDSNICKCFTYCFLVEWKDEQLLKVVHFKKKDVHVFLSSVEKKLRFLMKTSGFFSKYGLQWGPNGSRSNYTAYM